jgi:hypothetical protein
MAASSEAASRFHQTRPRFGSASINTTDPDSRLIARRGRTPVQGYNAQAVATPGQIILAADITLQTSRSTQATVGNWDR